MIRIDREFGSAVEQAVREAEAGTSAEIVVVVAHRSGSYLDVALIVGAVGALAILLVALFAPPYFPPLAVALETPLVFALVAWIAHRAPPLLRVLAPRARAIQYVERAAAWQFLDEAVHGTRGRTGILIYLSVLEERIVVLPDFGLSAHVPEALWATVPWSEHGDGPRVRSTEDVLRGIRAVGAILRERLPRESRDLNELPDAPRIVP